MKPRRTSLVQNHAVIDDFLPLALAKRMRRQIDAHFESPHAHRPVTHQVWNYWYVPGLYTYLRTAPEKILAQSDVDAFLRSLKAWSIGTLALSEIHGPVFSLYVDGCVQRLHNDARNGRLGFVYSLTKNDRRTTGGQTLVLRDGDLMRSRGREEASGSAFYSAIEPRFNRLVVFDDRCPHAVERVEGSMDPREGRFVLHGHLCEGQVVAVGPLSPADMQAELLPMVTEFREKQFDAGFHGMLSLKLHVAAGGTVSRASILMDRVMHATDGGGWAGRRDDFLDALRRLRVPKKPKGTDVYLPVSLGSIKTP